jgi:glycosyltransferase involved in cell wall biosynthesis
LVKEADALSEAGYDVHVICTHWSSWADKTDKELFQARSWSSCRSVGGHPIESPAEYVWTRIRHGLSRRTVKHGLKFAQKWALSRGSADLARAAKETTADLYIAHNVGALAPAVDAAATHQSLVGFDIEDFHSAMNPVSMSPADKGLIESLERKYLPRCDYLTASSPGIAQAYADKYDLKLPVTILNVFPLSHRPSELRTNRAGNPMTVYWFSQTIGEHRGLESIVRALGLLSDCEIELHLRGQLQSGFQNRLFRFANNCGLNAEKIVFHNPAPPDQMVRLSSQYDIGVALEPRDGLNGELCISNKLFTYLIAGNAIIATDTVGQKSIVDSLGSAGFCFAEADVVGMASQLKHWYTNRESLEHSRKDAWHWATVLFNWDLEKQKFLAVIEGVCRKQTSVTQAVRLSE